MTRKLVGFEMVDPGIARHGYRVMDQGAPVGTVTSGTQTPSLKKAIGMAYVPVGQASLGSEIGIGHVPRPKPGRPAAARCGFPGSGRWPR